MLTYCIQNHALIARNQYARLILSDANIMLFEHLLDKLNLGVQVFETVNAHLLKHRCMVMKQDTIIDDTLISAPSSTDKDRSQTGFSVNHLEARHYYFG